MANRRNEMLIVSLAKSENLKCLTNDGRILKTDDKPFRRIPASFSPVCQDSPTFASAVVALQKKAQ
jgi:hypothetical protein